MIKNSEGVISNNKTILGIDIGTTNIAIVLIDIENSVVLATDTTENDSKLQTDTDLCEYDTELILGKVRRMVDRVTRAYPNVVSIGITGQMHGILYIDDEGNAVSPLYNWQDGRGKRKINRDRTYCEEIACLTGYPVYSGYGFATLFYNKMNQTEPQKAKSFCTIMDYIAMKLVGKSIPVMHPTNAASLGLFDIQGNCFDAEAIEKLGLGSLVLPEVARDSEIIGYYGNIPVSAAIGDNQASFLGSVKQEGTSALVNFGTGSQISVISNDFRQVEESLEVRPYLFGKYLVCGSALCGGKAYAILENFFSEYAGAITKTPGSQYEIMNRLAWEAYLEKSSLQVSPQFCGTRKEPEMRGSISGIDDTNFTPGNLIVGVLQGMVDELKMYFDSMRVGNITELVASGNAIQKNPVLQMVLEDTFQMEINLTDGQEEAAIGAALYGGVSGRVVNMEQATGIITYRGMNNGLK